jgi:hypothetical protein
LPEQQLGLTCMYRLCAASATCKQAVLLSLYVKLCKNLPGACCLSHHPGRHTQHGQQGRLLMVVGSDSAISRLVCDWFATTTRRNGFPADGSAGGSQLKGNYNHPPTALRPSTHHQGPRSRGTGQQACRRAADRQVWPLSGPAMCSMLVGPGLWKPHTLFARTCCPYHSHLHC